MGIEPVSRNSQVVCCAHLRPSIWAHLGAQFIVCRAKSLPDFVDRIPLRGADYVAVGHRHSRIGMPHLIASDRRIRPNIH
jgi:hypothetical protein